MSTEFTFQKRVVQIYFSKIIIFILLILNESPRVRP